MFPRLWSINSPACGPGVRHSRSRWLFVSPAVLLRLRSGFGYPQRARDELIATGRARPHHILPASGWVTAPMWTDSEVSGVIALFRQNYERALESRCLRQRKGKQMRNKENLILVTAATGNVGRQVVSELIGAGARVRALTRNPDSAGLPRELDVVRGDLSMPGTLDE